MPVGRVADSPWLLHWQGTARIGVDPAAARKVLEQAHEIAGRHSDELCEVLCAAGMVEAYFLEYSVFTPVTPWIRVLERAFAPGFGFPNFESELRALSAMLIAATYREPDHPQIERCAERVRVLLAMDLDVNLRVSAGTFLMLYGSFTGHLDEGGRAAMIVAPLLSDPAVHIFRRIFAWAVICWYTCNVSDFELGREYAPSVQLGSSPGSYAGSR